MSDLKVPQNNKYLESKTKGVRNKVEEAFNDFKLLLTDKTHPENQTPGFHNRVVGILNNLLVAADDLDSTNPGEGIFGLIILALRSNLKLKDDRVKLEVEVRELRREIEKIKKNQKIKR
tara:strand:+ start:19 stop:375 length:357 start_codon:yes stop_codon:yes gene_type:complete